MADETHLQEILSLWDRHRAEGREVSLAELCRDRPDLLPELQRRVRALQQVEKVMSRASVPASVERLTFSCPGCGAVLRVPVQDAGRKARCPRCSSLSLVPRTTSFAEPAALPPAAADGQPTTVPPAPANEVSTVPPADPGATGPYLSVEGGAAAAPSRPSPPGYEIEKELGRGGMGVVYLATDLHLKRRVALKMILAGGHADEQMLARFRTEAESIARLHHPGIVQIYEIGEHNGLPFFSLEFCPGGSLSRKLGGTPLPAAEAAALVEKLAAAVQAAHAKGVVHRDLKPANVLLAEDGTPKVTDFGLARKLDEAGQTQTGAVMGTPSYMAPEQARGDVRGIGPAADVYALGAILYECLTGRPPFKAATMVETLRQVVHDEPVSPRQLQSRTPADLETITLKCLAKEPSKRYGSALALAEDLRRFQEGRPIAARPVGRLERSWRWCRRNPSLAGSLAAVALSLALGASVAIGFAIQANEAKKQAEGRAEAEASAKEEARQSEQAAITARKEVEQTNDRLLTSVAKKLVSPLALQTQPNAPLPPLIEPEVESLWELASTPEERLRLRFVDEALQSRASTRQLRDRAAFALRALLILDSRRRARVERLLAARLRTKGISEEQQANIALILAECGVEEYSLAVQVVVILAQAMTRPAATDSPPLDSLADGLSAVAKRLDMVGAREGVSALLGMMRKNTNQQAWPFLVKSLLVVAARLDSREAAATAGQAAAVLAQEATDPRQVVEVGLATLAESLGTAEARKTVAILAQALCKETDPPVLNRLEMGLYSVAGRLDPAGAREAATTLAQALRKNTNPAVEEDLARGLKAVAERMQPAEAAALLTQAISKTPLQASGIFRFYLIGCLRDMANRLEPRQAREAAMKLVQMTSTAPISLHDAESLTKALNALAVRLDAAGAKEVATTLIHAISKKAESSELGYMAQWLAAVVARLDAREAAAAIGQVGPVLHQAMKKSAFRDEALVQGVLAVAGRLEPRSARAVAALIAQTLTKTPNVPASPLLTTLSAVAGSLDAAGAKDVATTLAQAMDKNIDQRHMENLAYGLRVVAEHMHPPEAVALLTEAMSKKNIQGDTFHSFQYGLSVVAARLDAKGAQEVATALIGAMTNNANPEASVSSAQALVAVAAGLNAAGARVVATTLLHEMGKKPEESPALSRAEALAAVAARLDAAGAREVAEPLLSAMSKSTQPWVLGLLAKGLSAVSRHLNGRQARQAAACIVQVMGRPGEGPPPPLVESLSAVAARLDAEGAGEAATALTRAMASNADPSKWEPYTKALVAVAARLEPRQARAVAASRLPQAVAAVAARLDGAGAREVATALLRAMGKKPGSEQGPLAHALAAVAGRLDAAGAREVASPILSAMNKSNESWVLGQLAAALSAASPHLDARQAREAAAALVQAMGRNGQALQPLAQSLSAVAARLDAEGAGEVATALTRAIASNADPNMCAPYRQGLTAVATRLDAAGAREAAAPILSAMSKSTRPGVKTQPGVLDQLAATLSTLATRLDATGAREVAAGLVRMMSRTGDWQTLQPLVGGLATVPAHLNAEEAREAAATLSEAMSRSTNLPPVYELGGWLSAVAPRLDAAWTGETAAWLIQAMSTTTDMQMLLRPSSESAWEKNLKRILTGEDPDVTRSRFAALCVAIATPIGPGAGPAAPSPLCTLAPPAPPLPPQILVDLLKQPGCVGSARRIVLDQLGRHYHRSFTDPWDFVRFAEQQKLNLDLSSPPKRPKAIAAGR